MDSTAETLLGCQKNSQSISVDGKLNVSQRHGQAVQMDEEAFVVLRIQHRGGRPLCIYFHNQHMEMCYHVPTG